MERLLCHVYRLLNGENCTFALGSQLINRVLLVFYHRAGRLFDVQRKQCRLHYAH